MTREQLLATLAKSALIHPKMEGIEAPMMISARYSPVSLNEFLELGGRLGVGTSGTALGVWHWYIDSEEALALLRELYPKLKGWRKTNAGSWING